MRHDQAQRLYGQRRQMGTPPRQPLPMTLGPAPGMYPAPSPIGPPPMIGPPNVSSALWPGAMPSVMPPPIPQMLPPVMMPQSQLPSYPGGITPLGPPVRAYGAAPVTDPMQTATGNVIRALQEAVAGLQVQSTQPMPATALPGIAATLGVQSDLTSIKNGLNAAIANLNAQISALAATAGGVTAQAQLDAFNAQAQPIVDGIVALANAMGSPDLAAQAQKNFLAAKAAAKPALSWAMPVAIGIAAVLALFVVPKALKHKSVGDWEPEDQLEGFEADAANLPGPVDEDDDEDDDGYHEPDEPEEGDITTEDHVTFYQYGKKWLTVSRDADDEEMWSAINAKMKKEGFFPNVWFISDHGNAHLMERE